MDLRITSQDATDVDQSLPRSGASTSGFAIGDTGENQPAGEPSQSPRTAPIFTQISLFLSHQLRMPMTSEGGSAVQKHRKVRADISTLLALTYRTPVAKGTHEGTSLGGVKSNTEKFGPLKVVLGRIPPLYANHEVRLKLSARASPLTNTLAEGYRYEQQDQKPPLACNFFGRMLQFTSHRRDRSEAPQEINRVCY